MGRGRRWAALAVCLVLVGLCLGTPGAAAFPDVPAGAWYAQEVDRMARRGLVTGYPDGAFGPEREMSRSELTAVVARAAGAEVPAEAGAYWCAATLARAKAAGWLPPAWADLPLGPEDFERPVTREEAVYLLTRALQPPAGALGVTAADIADFDQVDPTLAPAILAAYNAGLTNGLPGGRFGPKERLTRAQAAVLLCRAGLAAPVTGALTAVNAWDSGADHFTQYDLTVTAHEAVDGWSLTLLGQATAEQFWNCAVEATEGGLRVTGVDYNAALKAGESATVGLIVRGGALTVSGVSAPAGQTAPAGQAQPSQPPAVEVTVPVGEVKPLHVAGTHLADPAGNIVQLRGVSTHGLAWFPDYVSEDAFRTLRDDWGANVVRLAMYTAEYGGYLTGGDQAALKALLHKGVTAADALGMYVIIDWHILSDGDPTAHTGEAVEFFAEMSAKYAQYDNVLYEICNEPQNAPWSGKIKPYAQTVLAAIRQNDPDAVVIVGTNTWSQDVEEVAGDRLDDPNVVYAFHFYAATHKDSYRQKVERALDAGVPVFVSECGLCDASGGGGVDTASAQAWFELLNRRGVSFVAWSLCNKNETAALLRPDCAKLSGWTEADLSESGKLFRQAISGGGIAAP